MIAVVAGAVVSMRVVIPTELANVNPNNAACFIKINKINTFEFDNIFFGDSLRGTQCDDSPNRMAHARTETH